MCRISNRIIRFLYKSHTQSHTQTPPMAGVRDSVCCGGRSPRRRARAWCCNAVAPFHSATALQRQVSRSSATAPSQRYSATVPSHRLQRYSAKLWQGIPCSQRNHGGAKGGEAEGDSRLTPRDIGWGWVLGFDGVCCGICRN